jgi:hypothetical protein
MLRSVLQACRTVPTAAAAAAVRTTAYSTWHERFDRCVTMASSPLKAKQFVVDPQRASAAPDGTTLPGSSHGT